MTALPRFLTVFGLLIVWSTVVKTGVTDPFDHRALLSLINLQSQSSLAFWHFVTWLGAPVVVTTIAILAAAVFWMHGSINEAKRIALAVLAATALDMPLKYLVHRARPLDNFSGVMPTSFSFPSGHVLFATAFYFTFALTVAKNRNISSQRLLLLCALCVVTLVLLSRLCLGVHYLSDVLGGLLSGLLGVTFVQLIIKPDALQRK